MKVLITGSSRGLGLSLAEIYAENEHEVIATTRNTENAVLLYSLAKKYSNIKTYNMDVSSWRSIEKCRNKVMEDFGSIDLIVNNAGVLFESDKTNRIVLIL